MSTVIRLVGQDGMRRNTTLMVTRYLLQKYACLAALLVISVFLV